jgi:hypothetical protein
MSNLARRSGHPSGFWRFPTSNYPITLTSKRGQRTYDRGITDFVDWYCSEPRLAFNRTVVLRNHIKECTGAKDRSAALLNRWTTESVGGHL